MEEVESSSTMPTETSQNGLYTIKLKVSHNFKHG